MKNIYEEISLIKDIMTKIENLNDYSCNEIKMQDLNGNKLEIEGLSYEVIFHYCKLLYKVGYLDSFKLIRDAVYVGQLTFKGCEFLEKIKSERILDITLDIMIKNNMSTSLKSINHIYDLVLQKVIDKECKEIYERYKRS